MAEEIVDFGFSAVTADEYEADQTDGANTGGGGTASPEALASMDSKIEQIMAHLAAQKDLPSADFGDSVKAGTESLSEKIDDVELKIDKILSLEQDEERAQTTADILAQLNNATEATTVTSKKSGEVVGKQEEIMKFLGDMSPKIDRILKMESLEAVQSLQKSSYDMSVIVTEIEERKKALNKTYKARLLSIEIFVFQLITNLQKDGDTKEYIKWPNRIEILEAQKTKIMQVTRSEI